jgi:hypothetical protein
LLEKLEVALMRVAANQSGSINDQLRRDERGLLRVADLILPSEGELLLVVDQFEEVFTLTESEADRQHFLNLLRTAATDARSRVRIVITLRADFYDRPLMHPNFSALVSDLSQRGLLDSTLVVMMGEMGRTPRVNAQAGRDHWSMAQSVLFAGGGVKPGIVVGATNKMASTVNRCRGSGSMTHHTLASNTGNIGSV